MKLEGKRSFHDLKDLICGAERLNRKLAETGDIFKKAIFEDEKNYIAIIFVGPKSRIRLHKHTVDNEVYTDLDTQISEKCEIGNCHYLENESDTKWLVVLAHKYC